jgi:spermidine synthase
MAISLDYMLTPIASHQGRFGSVRYYRDEEATWMLMDGVIQGGIRNDGGEFFPHAAQWPSFVNAGDRVLMVGLGIGEGILAILARHPDVIVTCVEIDPLVIKTTLNLVPALCGAVKAGRLEIVEADAEAWLGATERRWDVGCTDAYQSGDTTWTPVELLRHLCAHCGRIVANVMGDPAAAAEAFCQTSHPFTVLSVDGSTNTFYASAR